MAWCGRGRILTGTLTVLVLLLSGQGGAEPKPRPVAFRGLHFFIFDVKPGEQVSAVLAPARSRAEYGPISYEVIDGKSRMLIDPRDTDGKTVVSFTAARDGGDVAVLIVRGGRNWYALVSPEHPCIVRASRNQPAHVTGDTRPFHFYVPPGTKSFRIFVACDSPREGATVRILRPDGTEAALMTDQFDRPRAVSVRNPDGGAGVWAIRLEHPRRHGADFALDDVVLYLGKNIPPFLALDRSALPGLILRHPE